jgi:hypothetical protein
MKYPVSLATLAALVLLSPFLARAEQPDKAAESAALAWLAIVDAGEYAKSWTTASEYFRSRIPRDQWVAAVSGARSPLGSLKSRHSVSSKWVHSLPGAPDGEYVVIQFSSSFDKKAEATETVTPMKEADGTWHVSGYYIR